MVNPDVQQRIRKMTVALFSLANAIDRLPPSQTRDELVVKHDRILTDVSALEAAVDNTGLTNCYFGLMQQCACGSCMDCPPYVEHFFGKKDKDVE